MIALDFVIRISAWTLFCAIVCGIVAYVIGERRRAAQERDHREWMAAERQRQIEDWRALRDVDDEAE